MSELKHCTDLGSLFKIWKEAQEKEADNEYNKYKFGNVDKSSFCVDGIVDTSVSDNQRELLFIAKECNCGGKDISSYVNNQSDKFWLTSICKNQNSKERTIFSDRLAMLANAYYNNDFTNANEKKNNYDYLKLVSFINLNKRGGYSRSNSKTIKTYTKIYSRFIAEEINILAPSLIVCCGRDAYSYFNRYVLKNINNTTQKIVFQYHPSYWAISDENYIKKFGVSVKSAFDNN